MIGLTLGTYLARHFLFYTVLIFLLFVFLIMSVDLVELSRAMSKRADVSFSSVISIAALRAPGLAQRILPFAVMFGAASSLMLLNRRLELVVVRAAGVSVWQFILPALLSAILLGLFSALIYNPLALQGTKLSQGVEAAAFGKVKGSFSNKTNNFWLRVGRPDGDAIFRARVSENAGRTLTAVSVYRFAKNGESVDRIDAEKADFLPRSNDRGVYRLTNAVVSSPGVAGKPQPVLDIPVTISEQQLQVNTSLPSNISFWDLPKQAERAREAGRNHLVFLTEHQAQLANALLFASMVILSACVSLRFARFGQNGMLIFSGVAAGFVLYVASRLALSFGSSGLVSTVAAAWTVPLLASVIGVWVLLNQEDG